MNKDRTCFYTIEQPLVSQVKIKRSVFICAIAHIETVQEAKAFISRVSKEHKTATHNCWAYILGENAGVFHSSDAGEPSGTAGKPILNALQQHSLTHVAAVVTRYFGGVKLGIRGLIDAYSRAVFDTLENQAVKKMTLTSAFYLKVPYDHNEPLLYQLKQFDCSIINSSYTEKVEHRLEVNQMERQKLETFLKGCRHVFGLSFKRLN